jgi:hypothetical protein
MVNVFQNPSKTVPMKADDQTIRVDLDVNEIGGRKSHLPGTDKSGALTLSHVPNAGSAPGGSK